MEKKATNAIIGFFIGVILLFGGCYAQAGDHAVFTTNSILAMTLPALIVGGLFAIIAIMLTKK